MSLKNDQFGQKVGIFLKFLANDNVGVALPNIIFRIKSSLQPDFELYICVSGFLSSLGLS